MLLDMQVDAVESEMVLYRVSTQFCPDESLNILLSEASNTK